MLSKKKKEPKIKKNIPCKKSDLKKNFLHVDNRKSGKVKRGDRSDYLSWFHNQGFSCLECGTHFNIEAHHVISQDDRSVVPFCSYCHRGHEKDYRPFYASIIRNDLNGVAIGFYLHRGTRSKEFKEKWPDSRLLSIASKLYQQYKDEHDN